jgi:hypothetical protein
MLKIGHPVCSAIHKQHIAKLVLQWVTMWESLVLNSIDSILCIFREFFWLCFGLWVAGFRCIMFRGVDDFGVEDCLLRSTLLYVATEYTASEI